MRSAQSQIIRSGCGCPAARSPCSERAPRWVLLPALLSWGAQVIAVDLPRPAIWERLLDTTRRSGGTLLVPVAHDERGSALDRGKRRGHRAARRP